MHGIFYEVANDSCAFYIKQAFNLYDSGLYSLRSLTAKLYKDGFRSSSGRRVPQSTVEFILKNIFYTGVFKFEDKVYENAKHVPLFTVYKIGYYPLIKLEKRIMTLLIRD